MDAMLVVKFGDDGVPFAMVIDHRGQLIGMTSQYLNGQEVLDYVREWRPKVLLGHKRPAKAQA